MMTEKPRSRGAFVISLTRGRVSGLRYATLFASFQPYDAKQ